MDKTRPWYARDDADAQSRASAWQAVDPYPETDPALLNSADLDDYIATTGMLHP